MIGWSAWLALLLATSEVIYRDVGDSKPRTGQLLYKLLTSRVLSGAIRKLTRRDLSAVINRRLPACTKKSSSHDVGARKASGRRDFLKPHPGAL